MPAHMRAGFETGARPELIVMEEVAAPAPFDILDPLGIFQALAGFPTPPPAAEPAEERPPPPMAPPRAVTFFGAGRPQGRQLHALRRQRRWRDRLVTPVGARRVRWLRRKPLPQKVQELP